MFWCPIILRLQRSPLPPVSVLGTDEQGPGGCRKTLGDTVRATHGRGVEAGMRAGKVTERNGRLERDGCGGRFRGSGAIQGKLAGFQPGRLDGWSVKREGGRTGRAGQEFHIQGDHLPSSPRPHFTRGESEA